MLERELSGRAFETEEERDIRCRWLTRSRVVKATPADVLFPKPTEDLLDLIKAA